MNKKFNENHIFKKTPNKNLFEKYKLKFPKNIYIINRENMSLNFSEPKTLKNIENDSDEILKGLYEILKRKVSGKPV